MKIYVIFTFAFMFIFSAIFIWTKRYEGSLVHYYSTQCSNFLAYTHMNHYKNFQCPYKYIQTSAYISDLQCQKEDIRKVWEKEITADQSQNLYGCLNSLCCGNLEANIISISYDLSIFPVLAFLLSVFTFILGVKLYSSGKKLSPIIVGRYVSRIITFLQLAILVVMISFIVIVTHTNFTTRNIVESQAVELYLPNSLKFGKYSGCYDLKAYMSTKQADIIVPERQFEIKSNDGVFYHFRDSDNPMNQQSQITVTNLVLQNFILCPFCPGSSHKFTLVDGEEILVRNISSGSHQQTLEGQILSLDFIPIQKVSVVAQYMNCFQDNQVLSDQDGHFSIQVYIWPTWSPYTLNLTFSKPGYQTFTLEFTIGGLPIILKKSTGQIFMVSDEEHQQKGTLEICTSNSFETKNSEITFLSTDLEKIEMVSQCQQVVEVQSLFYNVRAETKKIENNIKFSIIPNKITLINLWEPSLQDDKEFYIVAQWPEYDYKELDLDLYIQFRIDDNTECNVNYLDRSCGGVQLLTHSQQRGTEVAKVLLGPYTYVVTLKKYTQNEAKNVNIQMHLYKKGEKKPITTFYKPDWQSEEWGVFCFDGTHGLGSLGAVQQVGYQVNLKQSQCQEALLNAKSFLTSIPIYTYFSS